MNSIKRYLSMLLAVVTLVMAIPVGDFLAFAEDDDIKVNRVSVKKMIDIRGNVKYEVEIMGDKNPERLDVGVTPVGKDTIIGERDQQIKNRFIVNVGKQFVDPERISIMLDKVKVADIDVSFAEIKKVQPLDRIIDAQKGVIDEEENEERPIIIHVEDPKNEFEISEDPFLIGKEGDTLNFEKKDKKYQILFDEYKDKRGIYSGIIRNKNKDDINLNRLGDNVILETSVVYSDMYVFSDSFGFEEGSIDFNPTRGVAKKTNEDGTIVDIFAIDDYKDTLRLSEDMSIFMTKQPISSLTKKDMVPNDHVEYLAKEESGADYDILRFEIPEKFKDPGEYYIVITNKVEGDNIENNIFSIYRIKDKVFNLIQINNGVKIRSLDPNSGSRAGIRSTLNGENIIRISNARYSDGSGKLVEPDKISIKDEKTLEVIYKVKKDGQKYDDMVLKENDIIRREIKVNIGDYVKFLEDDGKPQVNIEHSLFDSVDIMVPSNTDKIDPENELTYKKDVIVEIKDFITKGSIEEEISKERDILNKGFTYESLSQKLDNLKVEPNIIEVNEAYEISTDKILKLEGESFSLYRYKDKDGNYHKKYPKVDILDMFGSEKMFTNANIDNIEADIRIYKDAIEVDGTKGNETGNILKIKLRKGYKLDPEIFRNGESKQNIRVSNPIRRDNEEIEYDEYDTAEVLFKQIKENPIIYSIDPDEITIEGEKNIVIKGNYFKDDVEVRLDGDLIKNYERKNSTTIIFDAPPKSKGTYQIMVYNAESGGVATRNIKYEEKYTNLEFSNFNPKSGSKGLLVSAEGEDFQTSNAGKVESMEDIYKFIGTRVYVGNREVNEYNQKDGEISLLDYSSNTNKKLLYIDKEDIKAQDYYDAVILEHTNTKGNIDYYGIIKDKKTEEFILTDGENKKGEIYIDYGKLYIDFDGRKLEIEFLEDKMIIGSSIEPGYMKLKIKTPYKISENKIVGKKVWIENKTELHFEMPDMDEEGEYDIKLKNPDASEKTLGKFKYYKAPRSNPKIIEIDPKEGSKDGGNIVTIKGDESGTFYDETNNDNRKTSVFFGLKEVPKEDVLFINSQTLKVRVPEYLGELDGDKKRVIVSVVNFDGGCDSLKYGYTYRIAGGNPFVNRVDPRKGDSLGGEEATVFAGYLLYKEEKNQDKNGNGKIDDLRTGKVYVGEADGKGGYTKNIREKDLEDLSEEEWERFVVPILPEVHFGEKVAKWDMNSAIENITSNSQEIDVITPERSGGGTVNVYVTNNDGAKSTEETDLTKYTYIGRNPLISKVDPKDGSINGNTTVTIIGKNLFKSKIKVIKDRNSYKEEELVLTQFGKLSGDNKYIGEQSISSNGRATVKVNNLSVEYDKKQNNLKFKIIENLPKGNKEYSFEYEGYLGEEIFLPINILSNVEDKEDHYPGREYVRIKVLKDPGMKRDRLEIARGFSYSVKSQSDSLIETKLPSYAGLGKVDVRVINPDHSEYVLENGIEYVPGDYEVKITDILNVSGKPGYNPGDDRYITEVELGNPNIINIVGEGFTNPIKSIVFRDKNGNEKTNIPLGNISYLPENDPKTLRLNIPENLFTNNDLDNFYEVIITVEVDGREYVGKSGNKLLKVVLPSGMYIEDLTPSKGPSTGGTEVVITGGGLKPLDGEKLTVSFDEEEAEIISINSDKEIVVKTPKHKLGVVNVSVKIETKDGKIKTSIKPKAFEYTSSPVITSVVDPENEKLVINNISVEGGERIQLKGSDFTEGAEVIFNPKLRELEKDEQSTGRVIVVNGRRFELKSGVEGTDIEYIDGQNILVTTPEGKLGDKGVLVINKDGGVSNVYNLEYGIPEVGAPFDVRAELVYDQFIRVTWSGVRNALEYEIYVSEEGGAFEYVGSTELTSFAYQDIKPRTKYQFMVRAIGQYGSSKPLDESKSNTVTTGRTAGPEDKDGELGENTVVDRQGTDADITIGRKDFGAKGYTIDLTRGELAGVKNIIIRMPAEIVGGYTSGQIRVLASDYSMNFNPSVFRTSAMESNRNNSKAGVVFKVSAYNGEVANAGNKIVAGPRYKLEAETYVDKNKTNVGRLAGGINLVLDQNTILVQSRKLRNMSLSRYYSGNNSWINTQSVDRMAIYTMTGSRR